MTVTGVPEALAGAPEVPDAAGRRSPWRVVAIRIGHSVLVLWGAVTLTFLALHLVRGDVVDAIVGNNMSVTPAVREQIARQYGLGEPLWQQYLSYLGRLVGGDLGVSYQLDEPVTRVIGSEIGPTLQLMALATLFAAVLSLVMAILSARRGSWLRGLFRTLEVAGVAIPQFWIGILLLTVFSFGLNWFPVVSGGPVGLVLPAITLGLPLVGVLAPVLREGMERALEEPFVITVRARGAGERTVLTRHVLRHALAPAVTLLGLLSASLAGGAVVVEQVFSRPGIGQVLTTAVVNKDIPVVLGIVLLTALFYVVVNLIVDLLYPLIDPRLRD
jgi:peptide/nickel transport system permease protein